MPSSTEAGERASAAILGRMRCLLTFGPRAQKRSGARGSFFVLGALASGSLTACDLAGNLEDMGGTLVDPDAQLLDAPGRKLASGTYSNLELDGSLDKGGYVLAKRHDVEPQSLAIISFVGSGACEVSPAQAFQRISSRVDVALPGLIAYQAERDGQGRGQVDFVGFDCQPRLSPVSSASLPEVPFPRSKPRGLLTLDVDGALSLVDARAGELVPVADGVSSGRAEGKYLWTIEEGVAHVYDQDLDEVASWGQNVRELTIRGGTQEPSAVLVDDDGLSFASVETGEKTLVSKTGCAPVSLASGVVGYFDPCESRALTLSIPGTSLSSEEDRVTIRVADDVVLHQFALVSFRGDSGALLYLANEAPGTSRDTLRAVRLRGGDEPGATDDRVLSKSAALIAGNIYLDWDGSSGTLVVPRYDEDDDGVFVDKLVEVASNVAQLPGGTVSSPRGILERFDGSVGDLSVAVARGDGYETRKLAGGVPIQDQTFDQESGDFAFVGDFDGVSGTPYLVRGGRVRAVGKKALPGTLRFLEQPRAIAYLAENGTGTSATLRAWLIDAELDYQVAERVTEYRELPWPSPGLLYSVPEGDRAGIWFAKAR